MLIDGLRDEVNEHGRQRGDARDVERAAELALRTARDEHDIGGDHEQRRARA